MKKITIVWTVTLLVIVVGLTVFGLKFKKDNLGSISEETLVEQAKKYLGLYPAKFPLKGEGLRLQASFLKDEGFDAELGECDGYVVVTNKDMGFTYEPYVKCPDYVTKGYSNE